MPRLIRSGTCGMVSTAGGLFSGDAALYTVASGDVHPTFERPDHAASPSPRGEVRPIAGETPGALVLIGRDGPIEVGATTTVPVDP